MESDPQFAIGIFGGWGFPNVPWFPQQSDGRAAASSQEGVAPTTMSVQGVTVSVEPPSSVLRERLRLRC